MVRLDGGPEGRGWERLESALALFASERLDGLVAVHAAALWISGRVLLVPGTSHAGKSALCVAGHAAGIDVLTDEYALVDPTTGEVTGWQRPVRSRSDTGIERLAITVEHPPAPVALVALVVHDPRTGDQWMDISPSEAVLGLLANTVCARSRPGESLDAALAVARSARAVAGTCGDAGGSVRALLDRLVAG